MGGIWLTYTGKQMRPTLMDVGLRFDGCGYFTRPIERMDPRVLEAPDTASWFELEDLIQKFRQGDFSGVSALLECSRQSHNWRLKGVATQVLGHVGTRGCFVEM